MLGGHLDSWHAATGATDNGIGCSDDDGSRAPHSNSRPEASPYHSRCAVVEARKQGLVGSGRIRESNTSARRRTRSPPPREVRWLFQYRFRHRPRSQRRHFSDRPKPPPILTASIRFPSPIGVFEAGDDVNQPQKPAVPTAPQLRCGRASPGIICQQDPIEYQIRHLAYQSRHL